MAKDKEKKVKSKQNEKKDGDKTDQEKNNNRSDRSEHKKKKKGKKEKIAHFKKRGHIAFKVGYLVFAVLSVSLFLGAIVCQIIMLRDIVYVVAEKKED